MACSKRALVLFLVAMLLPSLLLPTASGNQAPEAYAGEDQEVKVGDLVRFGASGSTDPDGDSLSYSWDFDASNGVQKESILVAPTHVYKVAGVYSVTLTVSDGTLTDNDTITVKVNPNYPPVVDLGDDFDAVALEWVVFDTRNTSDPNGDPMTFSWDFDASDGIQEDSTEAFVQWQFARAGRYTVTLTVSDGAVTVNGTVNVTVSQGMVPIPGKKYDGGGTLAPGQRNIYMVQLTKGKGLKVTVRADAGAKLNVYTFESKHFFKFTETGDIVAISTASKEGTGKFSYSIEVSRTDEYYIVVSNPRTSNLTLDYSVDIRTVPADQVNGPGFMGAELMLVFVAIAILLLIRDRRRRD